SFTENHSFTFGIEGDYSQVSPGTLNPLNSESQILPKELPIEKGLTLSAYAEEKFAIGDWLNVSLGIRYSQFRNFGPGRVYLYEEELPKSSFSVRDSLIFGEGEEIASYSALEPRISLKLNMGENKAIKMGYHRSYQFISQISNTASAAPIAIWQLSNYHIEPNFADNYSIGYFQEFLDGKIESSVEAFYRDIHRLIEYKDFANLLLNESVETELLVGQGRSYGIEFYFNKKSGKHQFEGNYTYSRTQRQVEENAEQGGINDGAWYPSNFDKPHILNFNYFYQINPRNNISVNFTYSTGRPTTAPVSSFRNSNILNIPVYSDRNGFRIPDYHRLDFAYTTSFRSKRIKRWKSSWTFTVYNLYGRRNAYSVFFQQRPSQRVTAFRIAVLGTVFPAITYNFSF
ncbi:MAG: TonB-dependent receptor, partial [Bacteroidota bacterium]